MPDILMRLAVLVLVGLALCLLVWVGKRFVERQRRQALAAVPPPEMSATQHDSGSQVRILAFSSPDCHQCHTLQAPALLKVQEARGAVVSVIEVDAPSSPELTQRYHVLTLPTTVVLDAAGHAHAVNYGFANTRRLLQQVDEVLAKITA